MHRDMGVSVCSWNVLQILKIVIFQGIIIMKILSWNYLKCSRLHIQLTLVISTPLISILSLMSNWFLSPDYFPYVFIVFQLRVCRTTFMSTLQLSRPSFSVPEYIFHSFYYRVSRTRTMTKEKKNVRCGAAGLSVNETHNRPLINKSIF